MARLCSSVECPGYGQLITLSHDCMDRDVDIVQQHAKQYPVQSSTSIESMLPVGLASSRTTGGGGVHYSTEGLDLCPTGTLDQVSPFYKVSNDGSDEINTLDFFQFRGLATDSVFPDRKVSLRANGIARNRIGCSGG